MSVFDPVFYLSANPDVAAAAADPAAHFQAFGQAEGRNPDAFFNTAYYLARNPDVAAAVARGATTALQHYQSFGWREGRDPSAAFSSSGYLAANSDVAQAGVNPLVHYLAAGRFEGRAAVPAAGSGLPAPAIAQTITASGRGALTLGGVSPGSTLGFVAPAGVTLTGGDSGALTLRNVTNLHLRDNAAYALALRSDAALAGINNEIWPSGSGNPAFAAPATLTLDLTQATLAGTAVQVAARAATLGLPAAAGGILTVAPDGGTATIYEPPAGAASRQVRYAPLPPAPFPGADSVNAGAGGLTVIGFAPAADLLDLTGFGLAAGQALAAAADTSTGVTVALAGYTITLSGTTKAQLRLVS